MPEGDSQSETTRSGTLKELFQDAYSQLDAYAEEAAKKLKATCVKGFNHCCKLLTSITLIEGLYIAEELLGDGRWREYLQPLAEASKAHCYEGITNSNYFDKARPCVFLSSEGLCNIYDIRPSCCRYNYVVSDPAKCDPMYKDEDIAFIDLRQLQDHIERMDTGFLNQEDNDFDKEIFWILTPAKKRTSAGPIPLMVLWCMFVLVDDIESKEEIRKLLRELPTPKEWLINYILGRQSSVMAGAAKRADLRILP